MIREILSTLTILNVVTSGGPFLKDHGDLDKSVSPKYSSVDIIKEGKPALFDVFMRYQVCSKPRNHFQQQKLQWV